MSTPFPPARDIPGDLAAVLGAAVAHLPPHAAELVLSALAVDEGPSAEDLAVELQTAARVRGLLLPGGTTTNYRRATWADPRLPIARQIEHILRPLLTPLGLTNLNDPRLGMRLIAHLLSNEALNEFDGYAAWAKEFVERWQATPPGARGPAEQLVVWLVPDLVERAPGGDGPAYHVSFRAFLRARLIGYCVREGVRPPSGDLLGAAARLTPETISVFIDGCTDFPETSSLPRALQDARVSRERVRTLHFREGVQLSL